MTTSLWIHSLGVAVGATAVAVAAGLVLALWVAMAGPWARRVGWLGGILTLALPPFLPASAWLEITSGWRLTLGPERAGIAMLPVTALVLGLGAWPLTQFLVLGAWRAIQPAWLEAEPRLRGYPLFAWVLWPVARPAVGLATVLTLALALANFTVPTLFQVRVFTEEFWLRYNTQLDLAGAVRATWPLWLLPLAVGWAIRRRPVAWPREASTVPPALLAARWGRWPGRAVALGAIAVLVASLALPLGSLALHRRTWTELPGAMAAGRLAITNSFLAAAVTAVGVVGLAWLAAGGTPGVPRGRARRGVDRLVAGTWVLFLLPGVFLGAGLVLLANRPGMAWLSGGFWIVWLALALRHLAPAWTAARAALGSVDPALSDAARLMGARGLDRFRWVTGPQAGGPMAATAYALYLLCLWDVETLVLVQPPGGETLALRIFNLLHYGHAAQVNALCLVTLGLAVLPLGAWVVVRRAMGFRRVDVLLGCLVAMGVGAGCSGASGSDTGSRPLTSQLFSAVQVIGSRGVAPGQFNKPRSLACDLEDNLYVADITGRIQKFSPDGRYLLQWQMPQTDLGKAKGMSVDPAGNILVVEPHYQRVNHFRGDGRLVAQWGRRGTNAGEFILPRCIAVNSAGEYYLGEYTTVERVQRFAVDAAPAPRAGGMASARLLGHWGRPGQEDGAFNRAEGIAIGPGDAVYVADSCNHRVQVFDRGGRFLRAHGGAGEGPGRLSFPYDVRVDAEGRQFVCEFGNSRLSVFDAQDRLVETVGRPGREPGEFANPWAICLDSRGNLYVADSQNHRVQKLLRRPGTHPAGRPTGPAVAASPTP